VITHGPKVGEADSGEPDWNYGQRGADWDTKVWVDDDPDVPENDRESKNMCDTDKGPQSPIDLTTYGSDGFQSDYGDLLESDADAFTFQLGNLITAVGWDYDKAAFGFRWGEMSSGACHPTYFPDGCPPPAAEELGGDEAAAEDSGEAGDDTGDEGAGDGAGDDSGGDEGEVAPGGDGDGGDGGDDSGDEVVADGGGRRRRLSGHGGSDYNIAHDASVMSSVLAETVYETTQEFKTVGVEFHTQSEHTLDG